MQLLDNSRFNASQTGSGQLGLCIGTALDYPRAHVLHEPFQRQVERTPRAPAVTSGDRCLTYAELNNRANQLARYLMSKGVGPEQLVGVFVERGIEMLIAVIGCLKAGGAYVPLDPNYPHERLRYILEDAAPKVVLTQELLLEKLPSTMAEVVLLDSGWSAINELSESNADATNGVGPRPENLAYIIYTSGSTGRPKGVAIEHRNAVSFIYWACSAVGSDVFSSTLQSTSLNFDLAVYECFVPLATGGCVTIVENALSMAKEQLNVTLINTVPSAIKAVLDVGGIPESTRVVNLAGEPLRREVVERIFASSATECVCNLYGPSETTTYSSWISMTRATGFIDSIGRPISNTNIYVVGEEWKTTQPGELGEIFIGGAGVARGYLNRPELTAERFIADPFAIAGARMYKTGDLGRWQASGFLEYVGRADNQVKIRGYRIELEEIEARLSQRGDVRDVAVVALEDASGDKRLVAYLTVRDGNVPSSEELRAYLRSMLPEFMVPHAFLVLESLPLTLNGKIDRRSLPSTGPAISFGKEHASPVGRIQESLSSIWRELLKVDQVGRLDHFFDLGGDSLAAMRLVGRIRERLGVRLNVHTVFEHPVLEEMATIVEGKL